jgi:hypothetical protein
MCKVHVIQSRDPPYLLNYVVDMICDLGVYYMVFVVKKCNKQIK